MSIFSYAFGEAVIFSKEDSKDLGRKRYIGPQNNFGSNNIDSASYNVIKELQRYSQNYQEKTARFLMDIPNSQFLNTRMLVAAYYWFSGNDFPKTFTPDMFTTHNLPFAEILETSYPEDKEWKREQLMSLITYAMLIRRNQKEVNIKRDHRLVREEESSDESEFVEDIEDDEDEDFVDDFEREEYD